MRLSYAARRAVAYGNGWIPRADRLAKDGIGVLIGQFRDMAKAAGRDPAELPTTTAPSRFAYGSAVAYETSASRSRALS